LQSITVQTLGFVFSRTTKNICIVLLKIKKTSFVKVLAMYFLKNGMEYFF